MVTQSGPVRVLDRRPGKERENGGTWADSLKVADEGTGRTYWFDLAQHINGECPAKGERVHLRLAIGRGTVQALKKDKTPYEKYVDRVTVVGFTAVLAEAA